MMNIKEAYICPNCQHPNAQVLGIQALFTDARYDVVKCPQCDIEWRVYYKTSDISTEVTFVPQMDENPEVPTEVPEAKIPSPISELANTQVEKTTPPTKKTSSK